MPLPGKAPEPHGDPDKAMPPDGRTIPIIDPDEPDGHAVQDGAAIQSIPRFTAAFALWRAYRIRARVVDLAGNSLALDEPSRRALSLLMALPRDPEGFAYLRYEPVISPLVIMRDQRALTRPGSAIDRLVMRTFNTDPSLDTSRLPISRRATATSSRRRQASRLASGSGCSMTQTVSSRATPAMCNLAVAARLQASCKSPRNQSIVGGQSAGCSNRAR